MKIFPGTVIVLVFLLSASPTFAVGSLADCNSTKPNKPSYCEDYLPAPKAKKKQIRKAPASPSYVPDQRKYDNDDPFMIIPDFFGKFFSGIDNTVKSGVNSAQKAILPPR